jgi:hypothetical protein
MVAQVRRNQTIESAISHAQRRLIIPVVMMTKDLLLMREYARD